MRAPRLLSAILLVLCCVAPVRAQYTNVTAQHIVAPGGSNGLPAPVPDGTKFCATTTDANDRPASYRAGSAAGQVTGGLPACATTTGGAIPAGFVVIDSSLSYPANACVRFQIILPSGVEIRRDKCVQPSGSTWSYDGYAPTGVPNAITAPGSGSLDAATLAQLAAVESTANTASSQAASAITTAGNASTEATAAASSASTASSAATSAAGSASTASAAATSAAASASTASAAATSAAASAGSIAAASTPGGSVGAVQTNGGSAFSGTDVYAANHTIVGPPTINLVCAGDSRCAGNTVAPGQDLLTQISLQPQFVGHYIGMHNGAVGGHTCALMTSVYSANVQPYKPGGSVTASYLFVLDGHNDMVGGVALAPLEACYQAYLNQAVSDGFIPILLTSYYSSSLTDAQDTERQQFNDWLRAQPYLVVDTDVPFPPASSSAWYGNVETSGSTVLVSSITGYSVASGIATFTASNSFTAGQSVYLYGFPTTSACLIGQNVTVSATGLSASSFQAPVTCPNVTSTDAGNAEVVYADSTHLGPAGITLLAKFVNASFGIARGGTTAAHPITRDYYNPPSGISHFVGRVASGALSACSMTYSSCPAVGSGYVASSTAASTGAVFFGGNLQAYIFRTGTNFNWQFGSEGGALKILGATQPMTYPVSIQSLNGSLLACATAITCPPGTPGYVYSATTALTGALQFGTDGLSYIFRSNANTMILNPNGSLSVRLGGTTGSTLLNVQNSSSVVVASISDTGKATLASIDVPGGLVDATVGSRTPAPVTATTLTATALASFGSTGQTTIAATGIANLAPMSTMGTSAICTLASTNCSPPSFFSYSASATLASSTYSNFVSCNTSSTATLTLPATTITGQDWRVINTGTGTCILSSSAGIGNMASQPTTLSIASGGEAHVTSDGSTWRDQNGLAASLIARLTPSFFSYSAGTSIISSSYSNHVDCNGTITLTLTTIATTPVPQTWNIDNVGSGTCTIAATAIGNNTSATSVPIGAGGSAQFAWNGSIWRVE